MPSYSSIKQKSLLVLERTWSFWPEKGLSSLAPKPTVGTDMQSVISEFGTKEEERDSQNQD